MFRMAISFYLDHLVSTRVAAHRRRLGMVIKTKQSSWRNTQLESTFQVATKLRGRRGSTTVDAAVLHALKLYWSFIHLDWLGQMTNLMTTYTECKIRWLPQTLLHNETTNWDFQFDNGQTHLRYHQITSTFKFFTCTNSSDFSDRVIWGYMIEFYDR